MHIFTPEFTVVYFFGLERKQTNKQKKPNEVYETRKSHTHTQTHRHNTDPRNVCQLYLTRVAT